MAGGRSTSPLMGPGAAGPAGAAGADVIVVGAGLVGAAIAYRLARAGLGVALLDRSRPGQGTSATSFAWVNANDKPPLAYHRLNAAGVAAHRRLRDDVAAEDGPADWLHEGGGLELADAAGQDRLLDKAGRLLEWGYRVEHLDLAEVRRLEPHLRLDGLAAATLCPDEAWVDGPRFAAGVAAAAVRHGARLLTDAPVAGLLRQADRVTGVRLAGGVSLTASRVVLAAGRWTDRLAALGGVDLPLAPTCGLLAVTAPLAGGGIGRVIHVPGMNFRPEPQGGLVLQSGATDATVTPETVADPALPGCDQLRRRIAHYLPAAGDVGIVEARVGVRPMPADGHSVVGPVAGRPGLYLAVTHSGVTLAPILGELVAGELTAGGPAPLLAAFRPDRLVRLLD
jgi:glycine/D-amino acid oxidase-like deaminating enzyme